MREKQPLIDDRRKFVVVQNCETKQIDGALSAADGGHTVSEFLEIIGSKRRRYVLYALQGKEKATFEEVTEQVATWESKTSSEELDQQTKQNIRVDLHHSHLPKLEDSGIIRYDRQSGSVFLRDLSDTTEKFIDYYGDIERPE